MLLRRNLSHCEERSIVVIPFPHPAGCDAMLVLPYYPTTSSNPGLCGLMSTTGEPS